VDLLKIVIGDTAADGCIERMESILSDEPGVIISGIARDKDSFMRFVKRGGIDIAIVSLGLLDQVERLGHGSTGLPCKVVVTGEGRSYDSLYRALRYHADDYVPKALLSKNLRGAIRNVTEGLLHSLPPANENKDTTRRFFITKAMYLLKPGAYSLEVINHTYGTTFREGLFRMLFIKFDCFAGAVVIDETSTALQEAYENLVKDSFGKGCFDVLFDRKYDGIMILANYPQGFEKELGDKLRELFARAQEITGRFPELFATISVGGAYAHVHEAFRSHGEALDASWSRIFGRNGKVLLYEKPNAGESKRYLRKFEELGIRIRRAFEVLDIEEFQKSTDELFAMPWRLACIYEARACVIRLKIEFFEINGKLIKTFADTDNLRKEIDYILMMSCTVEMYKANFKSCYTKVMENIRGYAERQNAAPVRKAIAFVEKNYGSHLTMKDVAAEVNLNPMYFSKLFKKETGRNFTDFVASYRIEIAKELIKEGMMNVSEIARHLSFADARCFSKLFKKTMGVTPSEYRKLSS
jgi:two-component system response regulator YesN